MGEIVENNRNQGKQTEIKMPTNCLSVTLDFGFLCAPFGKVQSHTTFGSLTCYRAKHG